MNQDQSYAYDLKKYNEITSIIKELVIKNDSSLDLIKTANNMMISDDDYIMKNMMELDISSPISQSSPSSPNRLGDKGDMGDVGFKGDGIRYLSRIEGNQYVILKNIGKEKDQLIMAIYIPSHFSRFNIIFAGSYKFSRLELCINNLSHTDTVTIDNLLYKKYEFVKPYISTLIWFENLYIDFHKKESHNSANMANDNYNHVYVEYIDLYQEIPDELYSFKSDYTTVPYINYNNYDDLYPLKQYNNS